MYNIINTTDVGRTPENYINNNINDTDVNNLALNFPNAQGLARQVGPQRDAAPEHADEIPAAPLEGAAVRRYANLSDLIEIHDRRQQAELERELRAALDRRRRGGYKRRKYSKKRTSKKRVSNKRVSKKRKSLKKTRRRRR